MLATEERAKLADVLLESLQTPPLSDIEAEWAREIEDRVAAFDPGETKNYAAEDVFAEASPDFSPRGERRLKVSMVNIRTATPQINRFGTDAERGQSSEWEAVIVEKLRVLWSKV